MKKIKEYKNQIIISFLIVIGLVGVIFGKGPAVQGGIFGISWGVALLYLRYISNGIKSKGLQEYDEQARLILTDINEKGEQSEYFAYYNIDVLQLNRRKLEKKYNKQSSSFVVLAVVMFIIAFICII